MSFNNILTLLGSEGADLPTPFVFCYVIQRGWIVVTQYSLTFNISVSSIKWKLFKWTLLYGFISKSFESQAPPQTE